jgi:N-acetyl-1-D-myo-inositol-2-amino-2-deoxy-alpha-D-glucopyranoside deacetylase
LPNLQKSKLGMQRPLCLMVVLAHPDDESFGMGGTLAWYASQGVKVRLVCATRGEVGEVEPDLLKGYKTIADLRMHELSCAAQKLGLASVDYLGYRDSGMQGSGDNKNPKSLYHAPLEKVAEKIIVLMKKYKPQVMVTFDPAGGYLHPDHIASNRAAEKAFFMVQKKSSNKAATYAPQKLYFHTMPVGIFKYAVKLMPFLGMNPRQFGKNKDIDLTKIVAREFPTHARINYRSVSELRSQAAACHASQGGGSSTNVFMQTLQKLFGNTDTFMRAYPPPVKGHIEKDLFDGVL